MPVGKILDLPFLWIRQLNPNNPDNHRKGSWRSYDVKVIVHHAYLAEETHSPLRNTHVIGWTNDAKDTVELTFSTICPIWFYTAHSEDLSVLIYGKAHVKTLQEYCVNRLLESARAHLEFPSISTIYLKTNRWKQLNEVGQHIKQEWRDYGQASMPWKKCKALVEQLQIPACVDVSLDYLDIGGAVHYLRQEPVETIEVQGGNRQWIQDIGSGHMLLRPCKDEKELSFLQKKIEQYEASCGIFKE